MGKRSQNQYDFEIGSSSDVTPIPQKVTDITPSSVLPIVGGMMTKNLVEMGEEILINKQDINKK